MSKINSYLQAVRGRYAEQSNWPSGFDSALSLSFDLDAETMWTARDPDNAKRPALMSQAAYGLGEGMTLILDLLDHYKVQTTFFVPGTVAKAHPDVMQELLSRGHEIAHHGLDHTDIGDLAPDEERDAFRRAKDMIEDVTNIPLKGYRAPGGYFTDEMPTLLAEEGLLYSSNYADSIYPYIHREGDEGIVEIPINHPTLDDGPYFLMANNPPNYRQIYSAEAVTRIWMEELDGILDLGGVMTLILHPQLIGRPGRLEILAKILEHCDERGNVWQVPLEEMATWFDSGELKGSKQD